MPFVTLKDNLSIKKSANIFIVSNILQLINAIEAQYYFQTKNNVLVLLFFGEKRGNQIKINDYLHLFPYDKLIILENCIRSNFFQMNLNLIRELQKYSCNKLFVGFFSANIRRIICNIPCNEIYLVDDGTYAYALHNELYNPKYNGKPTLIKKYSEQKKKTIWKRFRFFLYDTYRKACFYFHGYNNDFKKMRLNFFTIFTLHQYENEKIIKQNFLKTRMLFNYNIKNLNVAHSQYIYFLGQPLTKLHNISLNEYIKYIKYIISFYKSKNLKIFYIPHPEESYDVLHNLKLFETEDFIIKYINEPFEFFYLKNYLNISIIASFFSSVLFTVKVINPCIRINSFILPQIKSLPDNILAVYDLLKQEYSEIHEIFSSKF